MSFTERVNVLKSKKGITNSSILSLKSIYDKAEPSRKKELDSFNESQFENLLESLKIKVNNKKEFKEFWNTYKISYLLFANIIYFIIITFVEFKTSPKRLIPSPFSFSQVIEDYFTYNLMAVGVSFGISFIARYKWGGFYRAFFVAYLTLGGITFGAMLFQLIT